MNTALFLTARMGSSRLPGKMLMPVAGRPALAWPLERLRSLARRPQRYVLCTTTLAEDDALAALAEARGWEVQRGAVDDVLLRYLGAVHALGVDFFVNVDGDDLLCSPEFVDRVLEAASDQVDYIDCQGLPFGCAPIGVHRVALEDVCRRKGESDTQGWGKYFAQHRRQTLAAPEAWRRPHYRMTLDYAEDLQFFDAVLGELGDEFDTGGVIRLLDDHPQLCAINAAVTRRYWANFRQHHAGFSFIDDDGIFAAGAASAAGDRDGLAPGQCVP